MKVSENCNQFALSILWAVCKLAPEECAALAVDAGLAAKLLMVIQSGCNPVLKQRAAELLKLCSLNYTATVFISKLDTGTEELAGNNSRQRKIELWRKKLFMLPKSFFYAYSETGVISGFIEEAAKMRHRRQTNFLSDDSVTVEHGDGVGEHGFEKVMDIVAVQSETFKIVIFHSNVLIWVCSNRLQMGEVVSTIPRARLMANLSSLLTLELRRLRLVNNLSVIARFGPMEALSNVADIGFYYVANKLIDIMARILQLMYLHCHQQILQDP
ncbi:unnamed protein product [Ilex paraguariensis]|uniref:U-box domain-containing protein n=1 Tax=Ilex paraguariensis TaxID=185542 RepID=A0ABC8U781_9AQUA